jgi:heat shock protein HslJ
MTDERMDARLRSAGEAWRAADAQAATIDAGQVETLTAPAPRKPHRRTGLLASAAVVAAAIVAGGAFLISNIGSDSGRPNQIEAGPSGLTGTTWVLDSITDANGNDVPVAGKAAFQIDASDHLSGADGCNAISGDVGISSDTISFGNGLATTEIACVDDNATATAQQVDAMLSGDVTWSINNDALTLSKAGAGTLVYRAVPDEATSTDPSDLIGVTWTLTTIEDGTGPDGVAKSVSGTSDLRIADAVAGLMLLNGGCNEYKVDVGAGTIDITGGDISTQDCAQPQPDLDAVRAVLTGHVTWVIEGDQLTITKDGVGALVYTRSGGGGSGDKAGLVALIGHTWTLQGIEHNTSSGGSGGGSSSMSDIKVTFGKDGRITIKHRCYTNVGKAQIGATSVDISGVTLETAIPCTSPTDPNEDQTNSTVDDLLTGSVQWQLSDGQLQLTKGDTTLDFAATASDQPLTKLDGTTWRLADDPQVTLTFNGGIDYRLETGCNAYTGRAKVANDTVTLYGQKDVGGLDCLHSDAERVRQFLESGAAKWSITDGTLVLAKDGTKLTFTAK